MQIFRHLSSFFRSFTVQHSFPSHPTFVFCDCGIQAKLTFFMHQNSTQSEKKHKKSRKCLVVSSIFRTFAPAKAMGFRSSVGLEQRPSKAWV